MRLAALSAILLCGCISPEQMSRNAEFQAQQREQADVAYTRNLANQCESIGYQRQSDPWRQCIMQLHAQNQQGQTALNAALIQGLASQPGPIPSCRSLPAGTSGYARAQGNCW